MPLKLIQIIASIMMRHFRPRLAPHDKTLHLHLDTQELIVGLRPFYLFLKKVILNNCKDKTSDLGLNTQELIVALQRFRLGLRMAILIYCGETKKL